MMKDDKPESESAVPPLQNAKNQWMVDNRDDWDILYQESVIYYWNTLSQKQPSQPPSLYDIYQEMGVINIEKVESSNNKKDKLSVYFTDPRTTKDKNQVKVVKVIPNFTNKQYHAEQNTNGWDDLDSSLTIKIPNRVLVNHQIAEVMKILHHQSLNQKNWQINDKHNLVNTCVSILNSLLKEYQTVVVNNNALREFELIKLVTTSGIEKLFAELQKTNQKIASDVKSLIQLFVTLLKLNFLCKHMLNRTLYSYFSKMNTTKPQEHNSPLLAELDFLINETWLVYKARKVFGKDFHGEFILSYVQDIWLLFWTDLKYLLVGLMGCVTEYPCKDTTKNSKSPYTIRIPEVLIFLRVLEDLSIAFKHRYEKVKPIETITSKLTQYITKLDESVYIPLSSLLSCYVSLGMFFPFGFKMSQPTIQQAQSTRAGVLSNLGLNNEIADFPTKEDIDNSIDELFTAVGEQLKQPAQGHNADTTQKEKTPSITAFNTDIYPSDTTNDSQALPSGDRGGLSSIQNDVSWEYFLPTVIAYNWEAMRGGSDNSEKQEIKDNTRIQDYKAMLYTLNYRPPEFVDIKIHFVDQLPYDIDYVNNKIKDIKWNYDAYIPDLVVAYPQPPKNPINRPLALCNLVARRVNEPFTTM